LCLRVSHNPSVTVIGCEASATRRATRLTAAGLGLAGFFFPLLKPVLGMVGYQYRRTGE